MPLPGTHAHNDYFHRRPLDDALAAGFTSVEVDVFAIAGELRIAHDRHMARAGFTLRRAYLEPLRARVRAGGGRVYRGGELDFRLLVDCKSGGDESHRLVRRVLADYRDVLSRFGAGGRAPGPISVVLTGRRPAVSAAARESTRLYALDGWFDDLDAGHGPDLVPLFSDRWGAQFRWAGVGAMPAAERAKLRDLVARAHRAGREIRFWGTPNRSEVWQEQLAAGVDWLHVDRLELARDYLLEERHPDRIPLASLPERPVAWSRGLSAGCEAVAFGALAERLAGLDGAAAGGALLVEVAARVVGDALWLSPPPASLLRARVATRRAGVELALRVTGAREPAGRWLTGLGADALLRVGR